MKKTLVAILLVLSVVCLLAPIAFAEEALQQRQQRKAAPISFITHLPLSVAVSVSVSQHSEPVSVRVSV